MTYIRKNFAFYVTLIKYWLLYRIFDCNNSKEGILKIAIREKNLNKNYIMSTQQDNVLLLTSPSSSSYKKCYDTFALKDILGLNFILRFEIPWETTIKKRFFHFTKRQKMSHRTAKSIQPNEKCTNSNKHYFNKKFSSAFTHWNVFSEKKINDQWKRSASWLANSKLI